MDKFASIVSTYLMIGYDVLTDIITIIIKTIHSNIYIPNLVLLGIYEKMIIYAPLKLCIGLSL